MMRMLLVLGLTACFAQAAAAELTRGLKGLNVRPTENITIYNAPPNALFQQGQVPTGILHPSVDGAEVYPLDKTNRGYEVQEPVGTPRADLVVTDQVDVIQRGSVERWIQLSDPVSLAKLGWIVCGEDQTYCNSLSVVEAESE
ncbi:MAG: hypothetical protein ABJI96_09510 [Paracoccaceae bacterium]